MIVRPKARELIAGVADDETFGPVIVFGRGGTAVEVIDDKVLALPPLDLRLAHEMIGRTRVSRILKAYRDVPAADERAVALVLVKLAQLVADVPGIRDVVRHGETGWLVPGDPDSLREGLARLLGDAALRERLGAAGRRYVVLHHATERVVERWLFGEMPEQGEERTEPAAVFRKPSAPAAEPKAAPEREEMRVEIGRVELRMSAPEKKKGPSAPKPAAGTLSRGTALHHGLRQS